MAWTPPPSAPDRVLIWSSQLAANDFPPVCAMTGAPVETWRRFRFSTAPGWSYALLVLVCLGFIGLIIGAIVQYAVSRRASGYLPLTRASSTRVALASWIPASLLVGALVIAITAAVAGGVSSSSSTHITSSLVYTKWVSDAKVTSGPEPGYKPALTELTGAHITSITAVKESSGDSWDLDLSFDATGKEMLATLTRDNVAACPGDPNTDSSATCPQRNLAIWLGLTQDDINNWEDSFYADDVSRRVGSGCVTLTTLGPACAKLVIDAITVQEIDGGEISISAFSRQEAQDLVAAIQPTSTTTNPVGSTIAWGLAGLALLAFVAGIVGSLVVRRLVGPRARVMEQQLGYSDRLVELRNVHPGFVAAVLQMQQVRARQYSSMYPPQNPPLPP